MVLEWLEYDSCNHYDLVCLSTAVTDKELQRAEINALEEPRQLCSFVIGLWSMIILYMILAGQKKGKVADNNDLITF